MRPRTVVLLVAVIAVTTLAASSVSAQNQQAPAAAGQAQPPAPPPTNLQVLPKDMTRPAVVGVMRQMAGALGVQCNYCHVAEGQGGRNDMAADDKPTKKTARVMIRMVLDINATLDKELGKAPDGQLRVVCMTCHRGQAKPKIDAPAPAATTTTPPPAR